MFVLKDSQKVKNSFFGAFIDEYIEKNQDQNYLKCHIQQSNGSLMLYQMIKGNKIFYCDVCSTFVCSKCRKFYHGDISCEKWETKKEGFEKHFHEYYS